VCENKLDCPVTIDVFAEYPLSIADKYYEVPIDLFLKLYRYRCDDLHRSELDVKNKIKSLESSLALGNSSIVDLNTTCSALDSKLANLNLEESRIKQELKDLQSALDKQRSLAAELSSKVAVIDLEESRIKEEPKDLEDLLASIKKLKAKKSQILSEQENLRNQEIQNSKLKTSTQAKLEAISKKLESVITLEDDLGAYKETVLN